MLGLSSPSTLGSKGFDGFDKIDIAFKLGLWLFDLCDKLCTI